MTPCLIVPLLSGRQPSWFIVKQVANCLLKLMQNRLRIVVVCSLSFLAVNVRATERQVLRGHVPAAVARLQPVGPLPGTNRLRLAIGLPLHNREGLTNLLRQLYDPASGGFRHYLTPEQFTETFGPTEPEYQAVIASAKANGLAVTGTHPNRMLVDVAGAVADVERAFQVKLRLYPHPQDARAFFAPDAEPSVDKGLRVLHISGLDNYTLPHPLVRRRPLGPPRAAAPRPTVPAPTSAQTTGMRTCLTSR